MRTFNSQVELLTAAKQAIATPDKWTQGEYGSDAAGNIVADHSGIQPAKMCALGAVYFALGGYDLDEHFRTEFDFGEQGRKAESYLDRAALEWDFPDMVSLNDDPHINHTDVMLAFDKAIEFARHD